jgi:methylenetetrahydrofolate dehydrogenase (NADP+)/methenyltetrahydrofolate cyclohydrolase
MILNGNKLATRKRALLKERITQASFLGAPVLKIIQVGDDPASTLYVSLKADFARKVGIDAEQVIFPNAQDFAAIKSRIEQFNQDNSVDGIMIQSPIPNLDLNLALDLFNTIAPEKDVDGLSFASLGKLWQLKNFSDLAASTGFFLSATPLGALDCLLLALENEPDDWFSYKRFEALDDLLSGKNALIINRSNIVGKPLAALLELGNATVTIAHSKTRDLKSRLQDFDLILPATGIDGLFSLEDFSTDQIIVDIGINNNNPDNKVRGDVSFDKDSYDPAKHPTIAPVPGGVGPLTVTNLLVNTFLSYARKHGREN